MNELTIEKNPPVALVRNAIAALQEIPDGQAVEVAGPLVTALVLLKTAVEDLTKAAEPIGHVRMNADREFELYVGHPDNVKAEDGWRPVYLAPQVEHEKPAILGRDRALIDRVAMDVIDAVKFRHEWMPLVEDRRGSFFDVRIEGPEGPTGHIARISVELLRVDPELEPK